MCMYTYIYIYSATLRMKIVRFCDFLCNSPDISNAGVLFSFDGASRGNPGEAAHGNGDWWGSWKDGAFASMGMIFQKGARLGIRTNNFAEARGLAFAAKSALHFHLWLTDKCVSAARF